jgi:hypothetical protein
MISILSAFNKRWHYFMSDVTLSQNLLTIKGEKHLESECEQPVHLSP